MARPCPFRGGLSPSFSLPCLLVQQETDKRTAHCLRPPPRTATTLQPRVRSADCKRLRRVRDVSHPASEELCAERRRDPSPHADHAIDPRESTRESVASEPAGSHSNTCVDPGGASAPSEATARAIHGRIYAHVQYTLKSRVLRPYPRRPERQPSLPHDTVDVEIT